MPITASLGALTYSKAVNNVDVEYWFIQPNNIVTSNFSFLYFDSSTNGINLTSYGTGSYANYQYVHRLAGSLNPIIEYSKGYFHSNGQDIECDNQFYVDGTDLIVPGKIGLLHPSGFPQLYVDYGLKLTLAMSTGASSSPLAVLPRATPASGNYDLRLNFRQYAKSSTNEEWYAFKYFDLVGGVWRCGINKDNTYAVYFGVSNGPNEFFTSGLKLDSNEDPIILYSAHDDGTHYPNSQVILKKIDKTPTGGTPPLAALWSLRLSLTSNNLISSDLQLDSSDNSYFTLFNSTTDDGYLVKANSSGTIQWQQKITDTKLYGLVLKSDTEIFVIGVTTGNRLWIAEFDDSGTIQWQNEMIGVNSFYSSTTDQSVAKIDYYNNDLYIGGSGGGIYSDQWFITKVPDDGSIVGTGDYTFGDGSIITYQTSSQTVGVGSLATANTSFTLNHFVTTDTTPVLSTSNPTTNKSIAFPAV
jgi:hypothetical protein